MCNSYVALHELMRGVARHDMHEGRTSTPFSSCECTVEGKKSRSPASLALSKLSGSFAIISLCVAIPDRCAEPAGALADDVDIKAEAEREAREERGYAGVV